MIPRRLAIAVGPQLGLQCTCLGIEAGDLIGGGGTSVADEPSGCFRVLFGVRTLCDLTTLLGRIFGVLAMSCLALLMSDVPARWRSPRFIWFDVWTSPETLGWRLRE